MRALLLLCLAVASPAVAGVILPWSPPPNPHIEPILPQREATPRLYLAATLGVAVPLSGLAAAPEACLAIGYQTPWWSDHLVFELGVTGLHSRRQGAVDFKGNALRSGLFLYEEIRNQTSVMGSVLFRVPFNRGIEFSAGAGPDAVFGAEHLSLYDQPFTSRSLTLGGHATLAADIRFLWIGDLVFQARLHTTSDTLFATSRAVRHVALEAGYRLWF